MTRWMVVAALLGLGAAPAAAQTPVGQLAKAKGWHTSYAEARAEAQRTGKPLLVVFRCEP